MEVLKSMKTEKQECSRNRGFREGRSVRSYSSKPLTLEPVVEFDFPSLLEYKGERYNLDTIWIDKETVDNLSDDECIVAFSCRVYKIKSKRGFSPIKMTFKTFGGNCYLVYFAKVYKREDVQVEDSNIPYFEHIPSNEFQKSLREYLDNEESIEINGSDLNHKGSSHNWEHGSAFILNSDEGVIV